MADTTLNPSSLEGRGSQVVRRLARRLAPYLPTTLTRQILSQELPAPGEACWLTAATLFSDMSGFTTMSEELAADGPRGAEELNRALLMTFTALINAIHDAGGAVSHFHGDAMMVYFPDNDGRAAERALACARFMQSLMLTSLTRVVAHRSSGRRSLFDLTIKIGVSYGRCLQVVVGEFGTCLEFVLAGKAVDEAVAAQQQARAGQVVAARAVLAGAGMPVTGDFRVLTEVAPVPNSQPTLYWEAFDQDALHQLLYIAPAFVPPALYERLQDHNTQFVAEHRPATSIFVRFEGIDFEAENAGELLQAYYLWAWGIVARYGGPNSRVNRILTGDKGSQLHIFFGAPVAPDAPEQAIRCALALQQEKPPFISRQKIGLAAGRTFACAVGSQNRREYTIVGSVVNLSARLAQVCPDGAVVTDEATANRVRELMELEELPRVQLKGRSKPVPLYRVYSERTTTTQWQARFARWQKPPAGRESEVTRLVQGMDEALQGNGRLVAISGPVGSGKARLLAAGVRHWLHAGGLGLIGVCQQHTADVPFGPWQSVWRDFFGLTPDMNGRAQIEAVTARILALCPDCADEAHLWGEVLGLQPPQPQRLVTLPVETRQARFFTLVRRCLVASAASQPLLIILEDIHWADQLSLDLLDELAQYLASAPVFIALTFRQSGKFTWRTLNRPVCTTINLGDLSPQQARHFLKQLMGTERLPASLEQHLGLRDHQGSSNPINPFFLEESLKMMLSLGIVRLNKDEPEAKRIHVDEALLAQMQVPDSIYALLLARLDQLSAAHRGLLQVAAVIGREFDLITLVATAPGMTRPLAMQILADLVGTELVQLVTTEPEPVYIFHHTLTHDVVYQSLPYARRQALHAAIADFIVSRFGGSLKPHYALLAYHYAQTDRHEDGLQYALLAAEDAVAMFANREAAELYKLASGHIEALGREKHWQTAVKVFQARADVLNLLGSFNEAAQAAMHALRLCLLYSDIARTLPVYNLLAEIRFNQARYAEVHELTTRVINSLAHQTPAAELVQAYLLSAMSVAATLNYPTALNRLQRAQEIATATPGQPRLGIILGTAAFIYSEQQKWDEALAAMARALELAQTTGAPGQQGLLLYGQSRIYLRLGQAQVALAAVAEAIDLVRGVSHHWLARALTHRAAIHLYLGQFMAARADLKVAVEFLEAMDDVAGLLEAYLLWGKEYSLTRNDISEARRHLGQALQLLREQPGRGEGPHTLAQVQLWLGLGEVALRTGHLDQAESLFNRVLIVLETRNLIWWRPLALYLRGLVYLKRAETDAQSLPAAYDCFKAALAAINEGGCPDELSLILLRLASAEPDVDRRWHHLEACVEAAQRRARYQDRLLCLQQAGSRLAQADDARLCQLGLDCLAQVQRVRTEITNAMSDLRL